jgi:three-Cys-motif partner protein
MQKFGGEWTEEKLERVRKYLVAYATIMSRYHYKFAYIDAFAGTGYRTLKAIEPTTGLMFPELAEQETASFLDGSARIALQVEPKFDRYIFIEKDERRFSKLERLKVDFPDLQERIILEQADANTFIQNLCTKYNWSKHRAVLFLDPFGMQVTWETVKAIAATEAIDLWYLFPLGMGVNRLLKGDGKIPDHWRRKLDEIFGDTGWYDVFYKVRKVHGLIEEQEVVEKAGFDEIARYFIARLKTVFPGVADNPLPLCNAKNNPLFLLCFASGNAKGATTAIKIAQDILKR